MAMYRNITALGLLVFVGATMGASAARRHGSRPPERGLNTNVQPPSAVGAGIPTLTEQVFELKADVHADEIRFDSRPQTHAEMSGGMDRPGAADIRTENMPRDPEPGRTYHNVTIHMNFSSLLEQTLSPLLSQDEKNYILGGGPESPAQGTKPSPPASRTGGAAGTSFTGPAAGGTPPALTATGNTPTPHPTEGITP